MDVFAFASFSETQGLVLAEAMAAGVPVIALNAPGVKEVVKDGFNGRLLSGNSAASFVSALEWIIGLTSDQRRILIDHAHETANRFSVTTTTRKALSCYEKLMAKNFAERKEADYQWEKLLLLIKAEWEIVKGMTEAASIALSSIGQNREAVVDRPY